MKPFIVGLAIIIFFLFLLVFWQDHLNYRIDRQVLKYCAEEASSSAMLYFRPDEFNTGIKVFDENEGKKAIEQVIRYWLKLGDYEFDGIGKVSYTAYFFDDYTDSSGKLYYRVIKDGQLIGGDYFKYKSSMSDGVVEHQFDDGNGKFKYKKYISHPTVVVTINTGRGYFRSSFILGEEPELVRSAAYEYFNKK